MRTPGGRHERAKVINGAPSASYNGCVERMRRTALVVAAMTLACRESSQTSSQTSSNGALVQESEELCAPYGTTSGRYEIRIEALGEADRAAYGLASVTIAPDALSEHAGATFELTCESPTVGPAAPFVIPDDPTSVVLPLVVVLPDATPFSASCELETYADPPAGMENCVPWAIGARVEAQGLETLAIDVTEL